MHEDLGPSAGATPKGAPGAPQPPPLPVKSATVIKVGVLAWAVALAVTLAIPALHTGERSWWPWSCVAGISLGVIGYLYIRRGRGNAAGVE